ncbi:MAG: YciI family protein [Alphaproteobacteria bacterium]|nr:YciI family protein [Alphaproteobacteria bacterium]
MLFVVIAKDKPGSLALRMATRDAHFAYGKETGVIKLGGPFLDAKGDMAGSLIIVEAESLEAAKTWHENDPYKKAGLFAHSEVQPWKPTFNGVEAKF